MKSIRDTVLFAMDDTDVLNADFDSSLLSCWESTAAASKPDSKTGGCVGATSMSHCPRSNHSSAEGAGDGNWDRSSSPRFSRLPSFTMEEEAHNDGGKSMSSCDESNGLDEHAGTETSQQQAWMSSSGQSALAVTDVGSVDGPKEVLEGDATNNRKACAAHSKPGSARSNHQTNHSPSGTFRSLPEVSNSTGTQMHPLAISSSANCPPHVVTTAAQQTGLAQMQAVMGIHNALFPVALTALGGPSVAFASGLPIATTTTSHGSTEPIQQQQHQGDKGQSIQNSSGLFFSSLQQQLQTTQTHHQQQQNVGNSINSAEASTTPPPPFFLFDAPVELRLNFMQSQRIHGLPVTEDNNSYHYGVAVNGFHPQLSGQPSSGPVSNCNTNHFSSPVQLVDGRHGNRKAGRIKNEREQRRAQKITELIDQLREKMEKGGWKVEVKSKFNTLSS